MTWEAMLAEAAKIVMTDDEKAVQRLSFAFGNTHIENAHITREMVAEEASKIDGEIATTRAGKSTGAS